jgi:hypothetical protein
MPDITLKKMIATLQSGRVIRELTVLQFGRFGMKLSPQR